MGNQDVKKVDFTEALDYAKAIQKASRVNSAHTDVAARDGKGLAFMEAITNVVVKHLPNFEGLLFDADGNFIRPKFFQWAKWKALGLATIALLKDLILAILGAKRAS